MFLDNDFFTCEKCQFLQKIVKNQGTGFFIKDSYVVCTNPKCQNVSTYCCKKLIIGGNMNHNMGCPKLLPQNMMNP